MAMPQKYNMSTHPITKK